MPKLFEPLSRGLVPLLMPALVPSPMDGALAKVPANNEVAAIGNSIVTQCIGATVGGFVQQDARGFSWHARYLSGQRMYFPTANAKGGNGETTTQILARITDVTGLSAGTVIIEGATNDVNAGASAATIESNLAAMITAVRGVNKIAILCVPLPRDDITGGLSAGKVAVLKDVRDWCRAQHSPYQGIYVADAWNDLASVPDSATAAAGMLRVDGIHPTPRGSYWLGYRIAQIINLLMPTAEPWTIGTNLCGNSSLSGTTGSKGAGHTGSLALSWSSFSEALTGDQAVECSKVTVGGIERQRFRVTGTFGSAFNLRMQQTLGWTTTFNIGDTVSFATNFEIAAPANMKAVGANMYYQANVFVADAVNAGTEDWPTIALSGIARLDRFTFPAGSNRAVPAMQIQLLPGTHDITVDFWHPHLIKH